MKIFKLSVLLSVYKKEIPYYLNLALNSIWQDQILKPNEIIIIKDGPLTDELNNVLTNFSKVAPVKFIVNETNLGLSSSLNIGLLNCTYDLIARMDTDDISAPERFFKQIERFEADPNLDILGSFAIEINETNTEKGIIKRPIHNNEIYKFIWSNPLIHPSVIFKKDRILEIGNYEFCPPKGSRHDDYDLWFRAAANGLKFENIPEPLVYYRLIEDTVLKNDLNVAIQRFKIGFKGCRKLKVGFWGYIGISVPLFRSFLPYPLNVYFNKLMLKVNPRNR